MKKILYMTLTRRWFDAIAQGQKKQEFRKMTPFWEKRLRGRHYDEVHFRNGYNPKSPFMRVEYLGFSEKVLVADPPYGPESINFGLCFALRLGRVLEIKNWDGHSDSASTNTTIACGVHFIPAEIADRARSLCFA